MNAGMGLSPSPSESAVSLSNMDCSLLIMSLSGLSSELYITSSGILFLCSAFNSSSLGIDVAVLICLLISLGKQFSECLV